MFWRRDGEIAIAMVQAAELRVLGTERETDCCHETAAVVGQKHAWEERGGERQREERVRVRDADSANE